MGNRYYITLGATTTAGGKVTSASSFMAIDGVKAALERDRVWCGACNSEGIIALVGPRLAVRCNGALYALDDDLCMCRCNPPPRLVATQHHSAQDVDGDWFAAQASHAATMAGRLNAAQPPQAASVERMPLVLLDPATDEPLCGRAYRLELGDRVIEGTLDGHGVTDPLTPEERAGLVAWQVGGGDA